MSVGDDISSPCEPDGAVKPLILIDSREKTPLTFHRYASENASLLAGDYSLRGAEDSFAIERKSVADLVSCSTGKDRARFGRQLQRLRAYRFRRLLIVGHRVEVEQHRYRSNLSPKAILSTLAAFEVRYDVPVVWASAEEAGPLIERWAFWFAREMVQQVRRLSKGVATSGNYRQ